MTCIVAITDGTKTVMGGDSAASSADNPEIYDFSTSKIFATGEYLVGVCGSYRSGQIARWEMDWPELPPGADIEEFMVREVVKRVRLAFEAASHAAPLKAQLLVALRGRLFTIGHDFSAGSLIVPWLAIGSGRHTAYGALHVLAGLDLDLEEKARRALEAAQSHTANVRQPFRFFTMESRPADGSPAEPGRMETNLAFEREVRNLGVVQ